MYIVLKDFADMQDKGYIYRAGDSFPRAGYEPGADRLALLQSNSNRIGVPLICLADDQPEISQETDQPKKRNRKKTADVDS